MKKQIARTTGRLIVMKNTMDMQNRMFVVFLVILKISDRSGVNMEQKERNVTRQTGVVLKMEDDYE